MGPDHDHAATARRTLLWDGVFSRTMDTLSGGVVLAGLALYLGADNFTIGVLASLPFFAQVAQVGALKLLMHVHDRRRVVVASSALSRAFLVALALLVAWRGADLGPRPLLAAMTAMALLAVVSASAWNWWIRDVIPRDEFGRYFGRRARITTLVAAAALLLVGAALSRAEAVGRAAEGYALVLAAAGLCGFASVAFLALTPNPAPAVRPTPGPVVPELLRPLRERANRRLALALSLVAASLTVALPFTAVYILRNFNYSFLAVAALALVSQLAYVGSLRGWGHLSDRFGNRPVLFISVGILVVALAGWSVALTTGGPLLLAYFALLHFLTGFAVGGIELTAGNVLLKNAPDAGAPAYLAALSLVRALAAGTATLIAGAAWQALGRGPLLDLEPWPGFHWALHGFHLLALASAALALAALPALRGVEEAGGRPVHEVAVAMRREVRMLSSVAGIRAFVHVVSYVVEFLTRPEPPPEERPDAASTPGPARGPP